MSKPYEFLKTVAAAATPERLYTTSFPFGQMFVIGKRAARTNNTGNVFLGTTAGNDTQPILITPGEELTISAPEGKVYDLFDWYLDVTTNADGLVLFVDP